MSFVHILSIFNHHLLRRSFDANYPIWFPMCSGGGFHPISLFFLNFKALRFLGVTLELTEKQPPIPSVLFQTKVFPLLPDSWGSFGAKKHTGTSELQHVVTCYTRQLWPNYKRDEIILQILTGESALNHDRQCNFLVAIMCGLYWASIHVCRQTKTCTHKPQLIHTQRYRFSEICCDRKEQFSQYVLYVGCWMMIKPKK